MSLNFSRLDSSITTPHITIGPTTGPLPASSIPHINAISKNKLNGFIKICTSILKLVEKFINHHNNLIIRGVNMTKRVLVIDDDFEDLSTMKTLLEKEGYEVIAATNGAKAFDELKRDGYKLILIDILMPTLSGYDLLRLMREKLNHKVPMVYISIVPKQDVDMSDADGFIQK